MAILRYRDKDGTIREITVIQGNPGKSAYEYAKDGGYAGTEYEYKKLMADIGGGNIKTILENIMTIIKAQVNTDGTPQDYSPDISDIESQTDALIASLGITE